MGKWFIRMAVAEDCDEIMRLIKVIHAAITYIHTFICIRHKAHRKLNGYTMKNKNKKVR